MPKEEESQFTDGKADCEERMVFYLREDHVADLLANGHDFGRMFVDLAYAVHIELVRDEGLQVREFSLGAGTSAVKLHISVVEEIQDEVDHSAVKIRHVEPEKLFRIDVAAWIAVQPFIRFISPSRTKCLVNSESVCELEGERKHLVHVKCSCETAKVRFRLVKPLY